MILWNRDGVCLQPRRSCHGLGGKGNGGGNPLGNRDMAEDAGRGRPKRRHRELDQRDDEQPIPHGRGPSPCTGDGGQQHASDDGRLPAGVQHGEPPNLGDSIDPVDQAVHVRFPFLRRAVEPVRGGTPTTFERSSSRSCCKRSSSSVLGGRVQTGTRRPPTRRRRRRARRDRRSAAAACASDGPWRENKTPCRPALSAARRVPFSCRRVRAWRRRYVRQRAVACHRLADVAGRRLPFCHRQASTSSSASGSVRSFPISCSTRRSGTRLAISDPPSISTRVAIASSNLLRLWIFCTA